MARRKWWSGIFILDPMGRQPVLARSRGPSAGSCFSPHSPGSLSSDAHAGGLPRTWNAWARSSEIFSLSAASAESSSFSAGCRSSSVLRSIRLCNCRSVSGGSRKSPMDSIQDLGASMVAGIPERVGQQATCQRGAIKPPPPAPSRSSSCLCGGCRAGRRGSSRRSRLAPHRHPPAGC